MPEMGWYHAESIKEPPEGLGKGHGPCRAFFLGRLRWP